MYPDKMMQELIFLHDQNRTMELSLKKEDLARYVTDQLNLFFPDANRIQPGIIGGYTTAVLDDLDYCFSHVNDKYFRDGDKTRFNHLNSDQYAMFLYRLSNILYKETGDANVSTKLFLLNKCLHGIDLFYEVDMPRIFLINHPIGTILGRGKYADFFIAHQNCNIGSNKDKFPRMGKYVSLHPGAAILGDCHIGENCKISAGSVVMDMDLDNNSVYIGTPHNHSIKISDTKLGIWI